MHFDNKIWILFYPKRLGFGCVALSEIGIVFVVE